MNAPAAIGNDCGTAVVVTPAFGAGRSVRFDLPLLAAELFAVAFGAVVFAIISLLLTFEVGQSATQAKEAEFVPSHHRVLTRPSLFFWLIRPGA